MLEPANTVIQILGGPKVVAEIVRRDQTRVRRWTYPKSRGGTGGLIPAVCQPILLSEAQKRGLPLTAEHFFVDLA